MSEYESVMRQEDYILKIKEMLIEMNDHVDKKMKEYPDNWALFGWKGDILSILAYIEDLPIATTLETEDDLNKHL